MKRRSRSGFTLVELLTATALTLILMATLATVFVHLTDSLTVSRATIEMSGRLQATAHRLRQDLAGYTVYPDPLRENSNDGYLEILEGPLGPHLPVTTGGDTTLADRDDVLMFTTRSGELFFGGFSSETIQSPIAEVAWFVRGTTLYRRVLLANSNRIVNRTTPVVWLQETDRGFARMVSEPGRGPYLDEDSLFVWNPGNSSFYGLSDQSVHLEDQFPGQPRRIVVNSLSDLADRRNRFAHQPYRYPYDVRFWNVFGLGLPTMAETSDRSFPFPPVNAQVTNGLVIVPGLPTAAGEFDAITNPFPMNNVNRDLGNGPPGTMNTYLDGILGGEDVILTNVIGFDVRVWDPGAPVFMGQQDVVLPGDPTYPQHLASRATPIGYGAFADLGYGPQYCAAPNAPRPHFNTFGNPRSQLHVSSSFPPHARIATYDTWTNRYEFDGIDQDGRFGADQWGNGFDDDGLGGNDDWGEREAPPPYRDSLRGVQITIRVFDPDTYAIRQVSVVQDFTLN